MAGHSDTLRSGYEAFARGDTEGMTAIWQLDLRWEGPNSDELPGGGVHEGADAVLGMLGGLAEHWDGFAAQPDEFHEDGDTVVVLGHLSGTAKATGTDLKGPFVHVWRMRAGKAAEVQVLGDTLQQAKALGIA